MSPLKGVAVGLLSSLLLLLLIVFGLALTLNMTVLNADFVTSQLDKLDMSSLAEEAINQQSPDEELPEEFETALLDALPKLEPLLKAQISAAIYPIYDYLKGKSSELDLADTLHDTIIIPDFIVTLLDELDISALADGFLEELPGGEGISQEEDYLLWAFFEASDDIITNLEPWLKEQVSTAIYPTYDYLLGKSQNLSLVISLEPAKEGVRDALWPVFLESPPPEFVGLPPAGLEQEFNASWDEFWNELWGNITQEAPQFEFTGSSLSLETPVEIADLKTDITEALSEAEEGFSQAREYIGYFQTGFTIAIIILLLSLAGIILINREVRSISRILGPIFLAYGVLTLIGIFIARNIAQSRIPWADMPTTFRTWLEQLVGSSFAPWQTFSIVLIVIGAALLAVSFIYRRNQAADEPELESPATV